MYYRSLIDKKLKISIFFLGLLIVGCNPSDLMDIRTPTLDGQLIPYITTTSNSALDMSAVTQIVTPNPTDIPNPTSTPFVYEVVENDTLTGIALQHSVALEDLIAANPGIDPNFLSIGLTLTIPLEGVISAALPSPTPVPIIIQPPVCYSLVDGSIQCLSIVENNQAYTVENVIVMVSLQSPAGDDPVSQIAITPLNTIPAGRKAAVVASFASPLFSDFVADASLLSAIPVSPNDQRYLKTELRITNMAIPPDGQQARITGTIALLPEQSDARTIWVAAFAYDVQNNIVGIRKWIADDVLTSGDQIEFELVVYSLGLSIDHVDVLTEIQP